MLNFQPVTSEYEKMYQASHKYEEGDIFIYADPEFKDENYPNGLVIIDAEHNVAAILGLRYFGELAVNHPMTDSDSCAIARPLYPK